MFIAFHPLLLPTFNEYFNKMNKRDEARMWHMDNPMKKAQNHNILVGPTDEFFEFNESQNTKS